MWPSTLFHAWVLVFAFSSQGRPTGARQTETVAFLGTSPGYKTCCPNRRVLISALSPLDYLKKSQQESNVNEPEMLSKPRSFFQIPSVSFFNKAKDDQGTCQCGINHVSPRTARIVMPAHSVLASRFLAPFVPSPAGAKTDGSFEESASHYFPGAQPSSRVLSRILTTLNRRQFTASNTFFGTSICPDEIDSKPSKSLSTALQTSLNKKNGVFTLGGLGGLPFVGETGMQAFLGHCPQQGKVFLFFGPHVGITEQGIVGKVERLGQSNPSSACGAVMGAYNEIRTKKKRKSKPSMDYQEEYIVSKLRPTVEKIKNMDEDEAVAVVTTEMYRLIEKMLGDELAACWGNDPAFWDKISEVTLFGGVLINREPVSHNGMTHEDYFQPVLFETWTRPDVKGAPPSRQDLYESTFGADPTGRLSP